MYDASITTTTTTSISLILLKLDTFKEMVLAMDGALPQIDAMKNIVTNLNTSQQLNLTLVKYAAGCSMTQSPNDVGNMHRLLHMFFKNSRYALNDVSDPSGFVQCVATAFFWWESLWY